MAAVLVFNKLPKRQNSSSMETILMPAQVLKKESRLSAWLKKDNSLLSAIMQESITNKQYLLILNAFISFLSIIFSENIGIFPLLVCTAWFALALRSCKQGLSTLKRTYDEGK